MSWNRLFLILMLGMVTPSLMAQKEYSVDSRVSFEHQKRFRVFTDFTISKTNRLIYVARQAQEAEGMTGFSISILGLDGSLVGEFPLKEGYEFDNFSFLDGPNLLAINASRKRTHPEKYTALSGSDRDYEKRIFLMNPSGDFIGFGLPPYLDTLEEDLRQAHFQQLISQKGKVYATTWGQNRNYQNVRVSVRELKLRAEGDNFRFQYSGRPLTERFVLDENDYLSRFPNQFLTESPLGDRSFVIGHCNWKQMEVLSQLGSRNKSRLGLLRVDLVDPTEPQYKFANWRDVAKRQQVRMKKTLSEWDQRQWFYRHFTQATMLDSVGNNLIMAYVSPNKAHPWYRDDDVDSPPSDILFNLHIQVLDLKGNRVGEPLKRAHAFALGVIDSQLYVFQENEKEGHKILVYDF